MKRFSEQLNKKAMTVKLRMAEKRELRERVVSYMEYHPLPAEMKTAKANQETKLLAEEYKEVSIPFKLITRWALGAAAIVIIAVPFAAERSVPGDGLYAVKRFNEEIRGTLAFDTVEKVEWETERLNRRIAEARLLASEGRLTDEVEAEVAEAVRTHSENAQKNIEVLRSEDADEATLASIAFETTLAVQSAALNEEAEPQEGEVVSTRQGPSILATVVEETRAKTNATNASSTIPAFGKVMAKVEQNTTRVYELRDSLVETATSQQIADITRRIEDIERSVAEAIALQAEDDVAARALLIDSLQRTQKLIVFMTDIEVSQTIDIESLVPVVLTDEEEQGLLDTYQAEFTTKMAEINEALPSIEDEAVVEKATTILAEVDTKMAAFSTSSNFASAETTIQSALDLVNNVYTLLGLDSILDNNEIELDTVPEVGSSTDAIASSTASTTEDMLGADELEEPSGESGSSTADSAVDTASSSATSTAISTENIDT